MKKTTPITLLTAALLLAEALYLSGPLYTPAVAQFNPQAGNEAAQSGPPALPHSETGNANHIRNAPTLANQSTDLVKLPSAVKAIDLSSQRDPFQPPNLKPKRVLDESRPELERYEISELRLTAIFAGIDGGRSASLENSSGRGFMIKKGSVVGVNQGIVADILADRVIIEEQSREATGAMMPKMIEMLLHTTTKK